jgi:hypothetical protein
MRKSILSFHKSPSPVTTLREAALAFADTTVLEQSIASNVETLDATTPPSTLLGR